MNALLKLQRALDPHMKLRELPPPHKSARVLNFAEAVVLQRNHEQAKQQSENFHNIPAPKGGHEQ